MSTLLDLASPLLAELVSHLKDSAANAPTHTWTQLIYELRSNRELQADWDGQGALATIPELVDAAIELARQLEAQGSIPAAFATVGFNATVFFEWRLASGFLEIEVTGPHTAEGRWVPKGANVAEAFAVPLPS